MAKKRRYRHNPAKKQSHLLRNVLIGGGVIIGGSWLLGTYTSPKMTANCNGNVLCELHNDVIGVVNSITSGVDGVIIALGGYGAYKLLHGNTGNGNSNTPSSGSPTINYNFSPASLPSQASVKPSSVSNSILTALGLANNQYVSNSSSLSNNLNSSSSVYPSNTIYSDIGNFFNNNIATPLKSADQSLGNWFSGLGSDIQGYYTNQGSTAGTLAGAGTVANPATLAIGMGG
jgi:hypothetical protein